MSVQVAIEEALMACGKSPSLAAATTFYSDLCARYRVKLEQLNEKLNTDPIIVTFSVFNEQLIKNLSDATRCAILSGPLGVSIFESWLKQQLYVNRKTVATEATKEIRSLVGETLTLTDEDVFADFMD